MTVLERLPHVGCLQDCGRQCSLPKGKGKGKK